MNIRRLRRSVFAVTSVVLAALWLHPGLAAADAADPPSRVARLAFAAGNVDFAPAGVNSWSDASVNRPLIAGDRLLTGDSSRLALDTGSGGEVRVGGNSAFNVLRLDDQTTQVELGKGTLNWRVDSLEQGQINEVDTPTLALSLTQPGAYRVDVAPDGSSTTISLFGGAGIIYGRNGASYSLSGHQSWRVSAADLSDIVGLPLPGGDDFDRWCGDRDARLRTSVSTQYVSTEVVGYSDLDTYGDWDRVDDYGPVWYPRSVDAGWAPYRYGHWTWIAPWGWTWIDDAPWGFAPFHYGRWVYVRERWGWVPGPSHVRPVYCPALVAFVGGRGWNVSVSSGAPIGWVPLGPRDVYRPWYRGSRNYFTNVNISNTTIINRTQVGNDYNHWHGHHDDHTRYMNQSQPGAVTVVSRDTFNHGRPVNGARLHLDHTQLNQAPPLRRNQLPAGRPGLGLQPARGTPEAAPSAVFTRPAIPHPGPAAPASGERREPPPRAPGSNGFERPHPDRGGDTHTRGDVPQRVPGPGPLDRRPQALPDDHRGSPSSRYAPRGDGNREPQRETPAPSIPAGQERPPQPAMPADGGPAAHAPRGGASPWQHDDGTAMQRPELHPPRPAQQPLPQNNPANDAQRQRPAPREEPRRAPEEHTMPAPRPAPVQQRHEEPQPRRPSPRERPQRERERD